MKFKLSLNLKKKGFSKTLKFEKKIAILNLVIG
jgi:hypothetical protein